MAASTAAAVQFDYPEFRFARYHLYHPLVVPNDIYYQVDVQRV